MPAMATLLSKHGALALALCAAVGCARSRLDTGTSGIDCGATGALAVVAYSAVCVYPDGLPDLCPPSLPFEVTDGEVFFCVGEAQPPAALLRAARASLQDAGVPADALIGTSIEDGGLQIDDAVVLDPGSIDAAPAPVDGAAP